MYTKYAVVDDNTYFLSLWAPNADGSVTRGNSYDFDERKPILFDTVAEALAALDAIQAYERKRNSRRVCGKYDETLEVVELTSRVV
jgi:hypothetical protein